MAPRRPRAGSNASAHPTPSQKQQRPNRVDIPPHTMEHSALDSPVVRMSPEARYAHNMKVLRRQDPSVISIFDQFPHVCVYVHDLETDSWVKAGYEGTMFVCERDSYPPYGLLVLNRAGPHNYVVYLYPEDDIGNDGSFTIIRSWPEFTAKRLAPFKSHPDAANKFSDIYALPELSTIPTSERGASRSVSFWWYVESQPVDRMTSVIRRLSDHLKRGLPYPDEFRDGNGLESRTSAISLAEQTAAASEIDMLFARFTPAPVQAAPEPTVVQAQLESSPSVDSLFAGLTNEHATANETDQTSTAASAIQPHGLSLLESIFASATSSPAIHNGAHGYVGAPAPILSPTPSSSVVPTVLDQPSSNPLHNLLRGLTKGAGLDSRASSAAPSSGSSRRSRRYEGDGEDSDPGLSESMSVSESSTVLEEEEETASTRGQNGDATPRPLLRDELAGVPAPRGPRRIPGLDVRTTTTVPATTLAAPMRQLIPPARQPVPFGTQSELWPYPEPRAPLDDRDDEIVELDFADTSALSDMDAFRRRTAEAAQSRAIKVTAAQSVDDSLPSVGENGEGSKSSRRKKGRKERAVDKAKAMDDTERNWEVLGQSPTASSSVTPAQPAIQTKTPATHSTKAAGKRAITSNGPIPRGGSSLDQAVLRNSIASIVEGRSPPLARNDFIREFWSLVQNDKMFVDTLYQDYLARSQ